MAEGEKEVNYASVVFKVSNNPPPAANRGEETVYGEVKVQNETRIKNSAGHWRCNHLACCLGILCVLLLGGIIAVCVYQSKVQNLTTSNQELETLKKNLEQQIQDMETNWNNLNLSRAQWSINAYCKQPDKDNSVRLQRKSSDLAVAHTAAEKEAIKKNSIGTKGYWIGLRVVKGRWQWVDGSALTDSSWIAAPADGQCAVSVGNTGWSSVSCDTKQQWLCQKKALSV
ncbi:hypothetical protein PBY51_017156 [Eleginops maclovinus]|uniref:C-type lectin domain-containing protein n=1 Tax=Eleginops maclovinus TaxID=56733 RepID=A0AAN7XL45_ELEMC|nr:hypothetical protein PBY51_017156 [Eleginops maclovinus]